MKNFLINLNDDCEVELFPNMRVVHSNFDAKSDPSKFLDYINDPACSISNNFVYFTSLSGNGLIVPKNITKDFGHIHSFVKNSDPQMIDELVDCIIKVHGLHNDVTIRTKGHEVPWLHVRFDYRQ